MKELMDVKSLQKELNAFYDQKTSFREKGKLRVLRVTAGPYDIFDTSKLGFEYDYVNERDTIVVLNKILSFKPDIIMSYDTTLRAREYYDHEHILYINENDYSHYAYLLSHMKLKKNEICFYYYKELNELYGKSYGDDSIYQHIVYIKMVPGISLLEQQLEIPEEFESDIVIISASNSSISRAKAHIDVWCACWMSSSGSNSLKEKVKNVLYSMMDIFYEEMDKTGEFIEDEDIYREKFEELMGESFEEFQELSIENK